MNESDYSLPRDDSTPRPHISRGTIAAIVAVGLLVHLIVLATTPFGVHRDEFLYMSMGRHLRLWRMDFPPAIAILANLALALFGDSLGSVRVLPALMHGVLIASAAFIARELDGRRFAQGLAAAAVLASPMFLRAGTLFQPVILDQLWWTLGLLALARIARGEPRWWIGYGGSKLITHHSQRRQRAQAMLWRSRCFPFSCLRRSE